jgi:hypothetical protein
MFNEVTYFRLDDNKFLSLRPSDMFDPRHVSKIYKIKKS